MTAAPRTRHAGVAPAPGRAHARNVMPSVVTAPVGPFVYLDVLGPFDFPAGQRVHIPDHPHTGLATISHLLDGEGWHGDDLGNELALTERSVNWMAAGNGIVHHEGLSDRFTTTGGRLAGIQAWLMLTADERRAPARFVHTDADSTPSWISGDLRLTLVSGDLDGRHLATTTTRRHAAVVIEAQDGPGSASIALPVGWEFLVHVLDGSGSAAGRAVVGHDVVTGTSEGNLDLALEVHGRAVLLAGAPLDEPVVSGGSHVAGSTEELVAAQRRFARGAHADSEAMVTS